MSAPIEFRRRALTLGRSTTKSKRALLFLVLLATALLLAGCTDHLDITGLPTACGKDTKGQDIAARVEIRIRQASPDPLTDTKIVNSRGVAELMVGADSQGKSLLQPGHRPPNAPQNVIYTADPISIELRFKDPCKYDTKTKTIVLDNLPQQKKQRRITYTLAYADF